MPSSTGSFTPMVELVVRRGRTRVTVQLKLESCNPTGSLKHRTAKSLLASLDRTGRPIGPGDTIIESTSGNLGLALAALLRPRGAQFVAVIDPRTPRETQVALAAAGAMVVMVRNPDPTGGYLLSRLQAVRDLCAEHPGYRWPNQYENPANPEAHYRDTGPELVRQAPDMCAVYVAVSTGGTLAGISRYIRETLPATRVVAVDAEGSLAICESSGTRLVSGIGAGRRSSFLAANTYDELIRVPDIDAFATCRLLHEDTGLLLGGSSGSVLYACISNASAIGSVCVCPDGGERYLANFYDDSWLQKYGLLAAVRARMKDLGKGEKIFMRPAPGIS